MVDADADTEDTRPVVVVYQMMTVKWGTGDQGWVAVHEDGRPITSHISSHRWWGIHDTSPEFKREAYEAVLGGPVEDFNIQFVVIDEGKTLPPDVLARNQALAKEDDDGANDE